MDVFWWIFRWGEEEEGRKKQHKSQHDFVYRPKRWPSLQSKVSLRKVTWPHCFFRGQFKKRNTQLIKYSLLAGKQEELQLILYCKFQNVDQLLKLVNSMNYWLWLWNVEHVARKVKSALTYATEIISRESKTQKKLEKKEKMKINLLKGRGVLLCNKRSSKGGMFFFL